MRVSNSSTSSSKTLIMRMTKRVARILMSLVAMLSLMLGATVAHAWGSQGHQVIAGLALAQLTPKARAEVDRLLAQEPGETLMSISTWADDIKIHRRRDGTTSIFHVIVALLKWNVIVRAVNVLSLRLSGRQ